MSALVLFAWVAFLVVAAAVMYRVMLGGWEEQQREHREYPEGMRRYVEEKHRLRREREEE